MASMFFGIPNLAWGIGVGYRYNIQVLNYSEKNDTKKQTTKDQGFGVFFEASL